MRLVRLSVWVVGMWMGAVRVWGGVNAGTGGAALPEGRGGDNCVVILGDLAPGNGASGKYLGEAVKEINLLRPAAVLTVGGLVDRVGDGKRYGEEVEELKGALGKLEMPWYPCVGAGDVAGEYEKRVGPLYYSVDIGGVHAIVLDSEEKGNGLSEGQLEWLRGDLNKVFAAGASGGGVKWVVVLVHRPLWRLEGKGNWGRVQRMLVDFNERPIVSVEGGDAVKNGPRVVGVWAGAAREYSEEPMREGIRYTVVGATAARIEQDAAVAVRHFSVVKFDEEGLHPALVLLGSEGVGAIAGEDLVTARERGVMDAMAGLSNEVMGVEGAVDMSTAAATQPAAGGGGPTPGLFMDVGNPLEVPLEVQVRLASARDLATATERENANPMAEHLDAPWAMDVPHQIRHLEPGAKERWPMRMTWLGKAEDAVPAQVEFVVRWAEAGKPVREVVLKRRVGVIPRAEVPVEMAVAKHGEGGWAEAAQGELFAWEVRNGEAQERAPEWAMVADGERLYVRVRASGKWGQGDEVVVTWRGAGKVGSVRAAAAGESVVGGERVVTCSVAREEVVGGGKSGEMNVALVRRDEAGGVHEQSWAPGRVGNEASGFGKITLKDKP